MQAKAEDVHGHTHNKKNTPHVDVASSQETKQGIITTFLKEHKTYVSFLFVATTAIVFFAAFSVPKKDIETYTITEQPLKQYVKVSGQVEALKDANLSFQSSGPVEFVGVKIGDTVKQGQVLATLSGGDAQSALLQAEANLASAQASLLLLRQGARKEEVAIKEQNVTNTKDTLDQSYNALPDAIQNVDATTADVIKNKFGTLFVFNSGHYSLSFSSCDQTLQGQIENKRNLLEVALADFQKKSSVITMISSTDVIDTTFENAYQVARTTNELVNLVSNLLLAPCSSGSGLDSYRTQLSLVKTAMTALFSDITAKRTTLITSKNAYNQALRDLELTKAGTDPYKIKSQVALVDQASAQVAVAKSNLNKTVLVAPFAGSVSRVALSLGEIVTPGKTVISLIAEDGYEVVAKVPEVDIVKVSVGGNVDVSLDAYGKSVIFPAMITRISPSAKTEGTVPMYEVVVTFKGSDPRIKQGMTANVSIVTEDKKNVIVVPSRFVRIITPTSGEVAVYEDGKESVKIIGLGIRGEGGVLEVTSGLLPGDEVIPPVTTVRKAQKQN